VSKFFRCSIIFVSEQKMLSFRKKNARRFRVLGGISADVLKPTKNSLWKLMSCGNSRRCGEVTEKETPWYAGQAAHAHCDSLDHTRASGEDGHMRKLILILLLGCAACTTQAEDPGRKATPAVGAPAASGDTLARIRSLIGDASCTESSQCRTLPIGALACGGPQAYLPYSASRTDEKALRALGEQYKAERLAAIKASGMASICVHVSDPGAVCSSGSCQLGASSSAPVAR
jgi:hypothetical protein